MSTQGHDHVVQLLIEEGADLEARATNGATALHIAASMGHTRVSCRFTIQTHPHTI